MKKDTNCSQLNEEAERLLQTETQKANAIFQEVAAWLKS